MESKKEKVDILMYNGIYDMSIGKIQRVGEEFIPSFTVSEALDYFCHREEFEKCISIKKFFQVNKDHIDQCTKEEWFGLVEKTA